MSLMPNLKAAADSASVDWQNLIETLSTEIQIAVLGDTQPLLDELAAQFPTITVGTSVADDTSAITNAVALGGGTAVTSVNGETGALTNYAKTNVSNSFSAGQTIIGTLAIGTSSPSASAILQADSTSQGFMPPRMTSAQRSAITSPATGLCVFDTDYRAPCFWDGVAWRLQPVVLGRFPAQTVVNNSSEADILTIPVPAGALGTDRQLRVHFGGLLTNNSGSNRTAIFSIYYGTTLMWRDTTPNLGSSANGRGVWMTLLLSNQGVTNSQDLSGLIAIGGIGGTTVGRGDIGSDEITSHAAIDGQAAMDSTVDRDFRVTVDFSGGPNANLSLDRYRCIAELL